MSTLRPERPFPTREQHADAWVRLAREIAERQTNGQPDALAVGNNGTHGRLTVLGSGIQTVGFSLGDRELIEAADKVFFCVADPATVVWLKRLRADAYDLYVLYDDTKPRYATYMQMAEAILHYVRLGAHVVCVFYGHPGIFVLSTHRAIAIARREGHEATMRAAVSALDCLCADLGVDPAHPGLQTHEATDLLVRRRTPDTSLHVVLWQVGLIGELGFRRKGYLNRSFSIFVDYLQEHYGGEFPVVHYIASRYPTVPPLVEQYRIDALHDPAAQARITGLSTFYLAPKEVRGADQEMVARLGLLGPGQRVRDPHGPLREVASYGPRETKALSSFAGFQVPEGYHWQDDTPASGFLIELRTDLALQHLYATQPAAALEAPRFGLSERERALLRTRDSGAIQIAAKGTFAKRGSNHRLLLSLLQDRKASATVLRARTTAAPGERGVLEEIASRHGEQIDWHGLARDVDDVNRQYLLPWTGVYQDARRQLAVTILGSAANQRSGLLFVNDERISTFTFERGVLEWRAPQGNPHNGFLRLDVTSHGRRRLAGQIWCGDTRPADEAVEADEVDPDRAGLGRRATTYFKDARRDDLHGTYAVRVPSGRTAKLARLVFEGENLSIDGAPAQLTHAGAGHMAWTNGSGALFDGDITFVVDPITLTLELFGRTRASDARDIACHGSALDADPGAGAALYSAASSVPPWVLARLQEICARARPVGGLLLWHRWEKHALTSGVMNRVVARMAAG